jgi:hypothetical protein
MESTGATIEVSVPLYKCLINAHSMGVTDPEGYGLHALSEAIKWCYAATDNLKVGDLVATVKTKEFGWEVTFWRAA